MIIGILVLYKVVSADAFLFYVGVVMGFLLSLIRKEMIGYNPESEDDGSIWYEFSRSSDWTYINTQFRKWLLYRISLMASGISMACYSSKKDGNSFLQFFEEGEGNNLGWKFTGLSTKIRTFFFNEFWVATVCRPSYIIRQ